MAGYTRNLNYQANCGRGRSRCRKGMCGRQLLSFRYLGRHFELEFACRKITGIISDHAILTALMNFMSGDSFYLLIVPGRAVSILN